MRSCGGRGSVGVGGGGSGGHVSTAFNLGEV